jgi:hypothetical protein
MKHIFFIFLILCAFSAQNIFSQNAPVSAVGNISCNVSTVTVPVTATNFTNIGSCNLKLVYNPAIATATAVAIGNPLLGNFLSTDLSIAGVISLGWFVSPGATLPDNYVIFNITFSKVSDGTSPLTWDDGDGYSCMWSDGDYNDLNDIPAANYYLNGSLSFGNSPVTTAPVITACPGTTISVPVTVSAFSNIGALSLTMHYNTSALTYLSFVNNSGFPGLTVDGVTTPGTIITGGSSSAVNGITLSDNTVLYTLNFNYTGGVSALEWFDNGSSCEYNGPSPTFQVLDDTPFSSFYFNGQVADSHSVGGTLAGDASVCAGTNSSVLTLTDYNGTIVKWQSSANGAVWTDIAYANPVYTVSDLVTTTLFRVVVQQNTCDPDTSSVATITVTPLLPVSVTIVADANPVNAATMVVFSAAPANGGTTPSFQWNVNGSDVPGATNSTFSYIPVNNDTVVCRMTSDLACVSGSPATSNMVIMVVNSIPQNTTVQDVTIGSGQSECYNALQSIIVAGGSSIFVVDNNGSATFIAGELIRFLPGTTVLGGGYLLGQIAPTGPFCGGVYPAAAIVVTGETESTMQVDRAFFMIYPNPTAGNFTLVRKDGKQDGNLAVEISGIRGERVSRTEFPGGNRHEFNITEIPAGLYFVHIIAADHAETIKLVKTR